MSKQYFSREPLWSQAADVKNASKEMLTDILQDILPLFNTELMEHQLASLVITLNNKSWLLALDMGSGKSLVALYTFLVRALLGDVSKLLVTAPSAVLNHWAKEVSKHTDLTCQVVEGTPSNKMDIFQHSKTDIVIVSTTWITQQFTKISKASPIQRQEFEDSFQQYDMLVIDEAHVLGNHDSVGFRGFAQYAINIPYRYLLTGTPIGNDYLKLWALYYLVDYGDTYTPTFSKFLNGWFNRIMIGGRRKFPIYKLDPERKQDFLDRFWEKAIRWEEAELRDLPSKSYITLPVSMNSEQNKLYEALLDKELGVKEDSFWDLMRITGGVHKGTKTSSKFDVLAYVIQEQVIDVGGQLIIWHMLVDEGRAITEFINKKFKKLKIGEARSEISKAKKDAYLKGWAKGDINILVANPKSFGVGLDLYEANVAVFWSNSFAIIDRKQAEKRIHRTGQTKPVLYIDIVCEHTIDEYLLTKLNSASNVFAGLTRDQVWAQLQKQGKRK